MSLLFTKYGYLQLEKEGWNFFMCDVLKYRYVIVTDILSFSFLMASNCQQTYRLHLETA
jgi:hypothetical protein